MDELLKWATHFNYAVVLLIMHVLFLSAVHLAVSLADWLTENCPAVGCLGHLNRWLVYLDVGVDNVSVSIHVYRRIKADVILFGIRIRLYGNCLGRVRRPQVNLTWLLVIPFVFGLSFINRAFSTAMLEVLAQPFLFDRRLLMNWVEGDASQRAIELIEVQLHKIVD